MLAIAKTVKPQMWGSIALFMQDYPFLTDMRQAHDSGFDATENIDYLPMSAIRQKIWGILPFHSVLIF